MNEYHEKSHIYVLINANKMMCIRLVMLICLFTADIHATSHWMVTETGLIQPKENSHFIMENPFDLVSFLNQDTRWENIFILYHDLIERQKRINKYWQQLQYAADMPKHLSANEHCKKIANVDVLDWYTSFVEDGKYKGIQDREFLIHNYEKGHTYVPDCKKISSLTFSMFAFEHLEGMSQRQRLNATPEFALPELFAPIMTVDQFGHWVSDILRKNSSSWLHYNLAAIYWRVKGNVPKAIECSRRAVHYAPRKHKSIPLLCLGTILHRSHRSRDAIIVLGAAVDHDPDFPISHFALGLAYAVRGDFNSSLRHLDICMKLHQKFDLAKKFRTAMLCHINMRVKIDTAKSYVKRLSDELDDYTKTEMIWLRIQTAFLKTMKHEGNYDYLNMDYNLHKMSLVTGLKISELKMEAEKYSLLQYFFEEPTFKQNWFKEKGVHAITTAYSLYRAVKHVSSTAGFPPRIVSSNMTMNRTTLLSEIGPIPPLPPEMMVANTYMSPANQERIKHSLHTTIEVTAGNIETGVLQPERGDPLYPPNMKVNRNREIFDTDADWPAHLYCVDSMPHFPDDLDAVYPVFMPFENKGLKQGRLLTEKIRVPALVEMDLPWHPPLCPHEHQAFVYVQKKGLKVTLVSDSIAKEYLKKHLMKYLADVNLGVLKRMQDTEIGQRIYTAINKKVGAEWVLYTVAGLYWRWRRQWGQGVACLVAAERRVPPAHRDVVLTSLASLLLDMGLVQDSSALAEEAYKINSYEPTTNFLLAQLSMIKKNHQAVLFHLKQTLRVDPNFMNGIARKLLNAWACIVKQYDTVQKFQDQQTDESQFCAEVQPGMSMVCEADGTHCHLTNRNCNAVHAPESKSALLRMLELKEELGPSNPFNPDNSGTPGNPGDPAKPGDPGADAPHSDLIDDVDAAVFDKFIKAMPVSRRDKPAHQKNYDAMLHTIHKYMKGCGNRGCHDIKPEDLALKEEDCTFQYLQLDYWLHIISFKQVLLDTDTKVPLEILSYTVPAKREPVCSLPADAHADFFLARVLAVETSGWQPVLSAMHQFAEMFNYYDYILLGSKIASFIEHKPESWVGLMSAMWWCGASGRGVCAVRCAAAALARLGPSAAHRPLRPLAALLHMQAKYKDAKDVSYLAFYTSPKSKIEAFLVAVSHTYKSEYEQAVWMYRYALSFDAHLLPAKACLHITMCLMLFNDTAHKHKPNETPA